MGKLTQKEIDNLVQLEVLDADNAQRLKAYFASKEPAISRQSIIFGVIGTILVGAGLMLIVAHNWEHFSRPVRIVLALLPLLIGQIACFLAVKSQNHTRLWKESACVFLFFAIGVTQAVLSQIYQLDGSIGDFLWLWLLLILPVVYLMESAVTALLYVGGITWMGSHYNYSQNSGESYWYWLMLLAMVPFGWHLYQRSERNLFPFLWAIVGSVTFMLGSLPVDGEYWLWPLYFGFLTILLLIGNGSFFRHERRFNNPFMLIGGAGISGLLLVFSFYDFWEDTLPRFRTADALVNDSGFWWTIVFTVIAIALLAGHYRRKNNSDFSLLSVWVLLIVPAFLVFSSPLLPTILANLAILVSGVFYIRQGVNQEHLLTLNFGLLLVAVLIISRFFDVEMSFVVRGVIFILIGIIFFFANFWMLRQQKR